MSELTSNDVDHLAKLARIELTDDEKQLLGDQLPEIVAFFGQLKTLADSPAAKTLVVDQENLRPDDPGSGPAGLSIGELAKLVPTALEKDQLVVPGVFSDEG
jgi:aspartyl/glutamyl-tRNA(Asn/Gln) amidotransferase C subunit